MQNFENELKRQKEMTNSQIIKFTIMEEFLPKHAKDILIDLQKKSKIKVYDKFGVEIAQSNKYCIAEKPKNTTIFKWLS